MYSPGRERLVENLHEDLTHIGFEPFVENFDEKASVLLWANGPFGDWIVRWAGCIAGSLDDRDELYELYPLLFEEPVDASNTSKTRWHEAETML